MTQSTPRFTPVIARVAVALALAGGARLASAESFSMPASGNDLIGEIRYTTAHDEDTLIDIARRNSVGQDEMTMANPTVDRWLPKEGTRVLLPREYILPDAPRAGIVVNIPEMRLYYYPVKASAAPKKPAAAPAASATAKSAPGAKPAASAKPAPAAPAAATSFTSAQTGEVITYPVSMGRMDWRTPIGKTTVVNKQKDPSWTPPASIKREHAAKGDPLPDVVPPGPDNPLGKFAMRLGVAGYLIHGTDAAKADGIGMRVTHGCMRLYNEDIAKLFPLVPVGAPVYLVNQPVKLGWEGNKLYMEVSQPLDEDVGITGHDPDEDVSKEQLQREDEQRSRFLMRIANSEIQKMKDKTDATVNMDKVRRAIDKPTGIPVVIGGKGSGWEQAAESNEGLAPLAGEEDPNKSALAEKPLSATTRSGAASVHIPAARPAPRVAPPAPAGGTGGQPFYSPANPYKPVKEKPPVEDSSYTRPADAKTSPYPDESVTDAVEAPAPEEE
jgi:L,D-transpeptidase ErfK/SrfK